MTSTSQISVNSGNNRVAGGAMIGIGVIVLAVAALAVWVVQASGPARAALEQQRRSEIAAESRLICEKWGQSAGTQQHAACVVDLANVRANHEHRVLAYADLL